MEITLAIAIMIGLASIVGYSVSTIADWKNGRAAAEDLRSVYVAQKGYLADHPAFDPEDFTADKILPYLPNKTNALPLITVKDPDTKQDVTLTPKITVIPPVFAQGDTVYDPSGSSDDGIWDTGGL